MLKKLQEKLVVNQIKNAEVTNEERQVAEQKLIFKENVKVIKENVEAASDK